MFPFVGDFIEVVSHDAVRYRGQLQDIDSSRQSITLVKVHHFGSEDRSLSGHEPKMPKGLLPLEERRTFYAEYIAGYRVVESGCGMLPTPANGKEEEQETRVDAETQQQPTVPDTPQEVAHTEPSQSSTLESSVEGREEEVWEVMDESGSEESISQDTPNDSSNDSSKEEERDYRSGGERQVDPVYFLAQLQNHRVVGVLFNGDECPSAPVYMAFFYNSFSCTPLISQLWRVARYKWDARLPEQGGLVHLQFLHSDAGIGLRNFIHRNKCVPWMADYLIQHQATARGEVELVRDAVTKRSNGRISVIANTRRRLGTYVEVDAPSALRHVRLCGKQYSTTSSRGLRFEELRFNDSVDVEMVILPRGCWVGPRFVLPDIPYHERRAPFRPSLVPRYKTVRSENEEYLPCRIWR